MDDTLSIKDLDTSTLDSANFPGSAKAFPRVASPANDYRRQNLAIDSRSPSIIRIVHTPRSLKNALQRSTIALDQVLARVDTEDNPIGEDRFTVSFQSLCPSGVSLTEYRAAVKLLMGALLASDAALITAMYNAEY